MVTPSVVHQTLQLPKHHTYDAAVSETLLKNMMASVGFEGSFEKTGQQKRHLLRREWSFFFDYITRAFCNKCTHFDAIAILSQQIRYALIHNLHFDFGTSILKFIGDRMTEYLNVVYFARFCQLIFTQCCKRCSHL